ncbi:MAG: protein kinase domain-containing protein [Phycisphaerales bacterium]
MPNHLPYRGEDAPDTSGVTGPVSGPAGPGGTGKSRSNTGHSSLASGALFSAPEPRPERIGAYKIVGELGRGGMGVVYLAVRESDPIKNKVALKVVKRGMDSEEIVRRFNIERQVLASLNHPNIARLIDAAQTEDGRPYFVMEYVEGKPLDRHCDEERLTVDQRLALFRQVCAGVQHAHQNLIVHRDLKPSNVLVTSSGSVKLMDFGIAKVLNPQMAGVIGDPTEVGLRVMTTEYASPEQVRGDPIGTASDVYSLGVMLYEILTGRRPYRFRTKLEEEIKRVVCDSEPARPSTAVTQQDSYVTSAGETRVIDPTALAKSREGAPEKLKRKLSGDIDNIVMMAMRKETGRRYLSADQMSEDIRCHLEGRPVIATPDRPLYRAGKFLRRNRVAAGSLAAVMVALAAGLSVALWQRWEAVKQRDIAEQQTALAEQRSTQLESTVAYIDSSLSSVLTTFENKVGKLEGGMAAKSELVEEAVKNLDKMPKEIENFAPARVHRARLLQRLGDLRGGLRSPTQNLPAEALPLYDKAVETFRELAARPSATDEDRFLLAGAILRRGDALTKMNRLEEAAGASDEARKILEDALKASKSAPAKMHRMLADIITQKGQVLLDQGKGTEALAEFEKARTLYAGMQTEDGAAAMNNRRNIAVNLNKIGDALTKLGRHEEALAKFEESLKMRRAFVAEEANDRTRRDLAVTLYYRAMTLCRLARHEEAETNASEAVGIMAELTAAQEANAGRDARAVRDRQTFEKALSDIKAARAAGGPCA